VVMAKGQLFECEALEARVHRVEGSADNKDECKPRPTLPRSFGNRLGTHEGQ